MRKLLFILFLLLLSLPLLSVAQSSTTSSVQAKTLNLFLKDGTTALIQFSNGYTLYVQSSQSINFTGTITVTIYAPGSAYNLIINGVEYHSSTVTLSINSSETLIVEAVLVLDRVTVDILGSGSLALTLSNGSTLTLSHSTSFLVANQTTLYITSSKPFVVNNYGIPTTYFVQRVLQNITLIINFNTQNISTTNLAKIMIIINGEGVLEVEIEGNNSILTTFAINSSTTFYAPLESEVQLYSSKMFIINGEKTDEYKFYVNNTYITLNITLSSTSSTVSSNNTITTTSNSFTSTTTTSTTQQTQQPPSVSIPPVTTSTNRGESFNQLSIMFSIIILIILILVIIFIIYRRIMQRPSPKVRGRPRTR